MRNIKGFVQAFFIVIVSGTSLLYAQNMSITSKYDKMVLFFDNVKPERHSIGHVEMRVYYNTETVIDTAAGTVMSERTVLEIGGKKTKYMTYNLFKLDSLLETTESSPFEVFIRQRMRDFYPQTFYEVYYTDYDSRTMQCTGRIVNTDFMYKENVPDLEWTVTDSTKSIGSWVVQKATCSFRGRNYTAWFTAEIPLSYGPWKFSGLPGLVLEVYDDSRDYVISIQSITSDCSDDMWFTDYDYLRLSRKKYLDARDKIVSNFLLYNSDFNKADIKFSPTGEYHRKDLAYGFMELDYK